MKKFEKEIKQAQLDAEKLAYEELSKTYRKALNDVNHKYKNLRKQFDRLMKLESQFEDDPKRLEIIQSQIQSKIYQIDYQESLRKQIDSAMKVLEYKTVKTCDDYMNKMYEEGFISQFYALQKRGVPVLAPINHKLMITAIKQDINGIPLSKRIYKNVDKAKKEIIAEISRGIATGMSNQDVARNIKNRMGVSYRKAKQLAQNEGHRVNTQACIDGMHEAKKKGADIVKQWDATFDGKTRPEHAELDQKWAEVDEPFKYSGGEVFAPKQFGIAALDINCRCALLSVPRWDIEDTVTKRDNITGELIEAKNYADWKKKYYNVVENTDNNNPDKWDSGIIGKTFDTKEQAIKYFNNDLNIAFSDSRKYPIDEQVVKDIATWQSKFNEAFKEFDESIQYKLPRIVMNPPSKMNKGYTLGYFQYRTNGQVVELALEAKNHSSFDGIKAQTEGTFSRGWHSGSNPIHTYIHEYGHYVSHSMTNAHGMTWEYNFIKECVDEFKKTHSDYVYSTHVGLKDYLSKYGTSSESECFAEAFAEYFGEDEPREFAKIFGDKLVKLMKGVT